MRGGQIGKQGRAPRALLRCHRQHLQRNVGDFAPGRGDGSGGGFVRQNHVSEHEGEGGFGIAALFRQPGQAAAGIEIREDIAGQGIETKHPQRFAARVDVAVDHRQQRLHRRQLAIAPALPQREVVRFQQPVPSRHMGVGEPRVGLAQGGADGHGEQMHRRKRQDGQRHADEGCERRDGMP